MLLLPLGSSLRRVGLAMPIQAVAYTQLESPFIVETDTNTHPQVEEVRVDMAAMKVDCRPVELLTSVGSCVGICLYDSKHKCGGLAHIMLPHTHLGPQEPLPSKFADTAVPALIQAIQEVTGKQGRISARIAGGANMFANTLAKGLDIGAKNVVAVREALNAHRVPLVGEDVGGSQGRRISFNLVSGAITVRTHNGEIKKL
ncbi:MAG: chemotaxis protein CheD [Candidatus Bathyarchaeota archaeon]|nr:chemotaxis protein CheD [Candidatus Bathyarchaeota archaeon]